MRKIKFLSILIIFLLLIPATIAFAQKNPEKGPGDGILRFITSQKWWTIPELANELKLSKEQVKKLEEIYVNYNREVIKLRADLDSKKFELEYLLQQDVFDMKAIEKAIDEMTESAKILEKFEIMTRVEMLNVLTPEQRKKLMAFIIEFMKDKRGPKD